MDFIFFPISFFFLNLSRGVNARSFSANRTDQILVDEKNKFQTSDLQHKKVILTLVWFLNIQSNEVLSLHPKHSCWTTCFCFQGGLVYHQQRTDGALRC